MGNRSIAKVIAVNVGHDDSAIISPIEGQYHHRGNALRVMKFRGLENSLVQGLLNSWNNRQHGALSGLRLNHIWQSGLAPRASAWYTCLPTLPAIVYRVLVRYRPDRALQR